MEIETTLKLTDALRAAVLALAGVEGGPVSEVLSGHGAHPHAAYVALPFASENQKYADGHILGLAVVLPRQLTHDTRRQALRALAKLSHLNVLRVGRLDLERVTAQSPSPAFNLRPQAWTDPATVWTSATPVLLDRFPKKHRHRAEDTITRSCRDVGLPEPTDVCVSRYASLFGVEPSGRFLKVRRDGDPPRLSTHVTLTFDHPVRGPVLLGAGRYFGLGLMRPCRDQGGRP
jgi:CRISPR-associated protein Csb2